MSDKVKGFTITLENDVNIDDVEKIMKLFSMIRGVAHVEPNIVNVDDHINRYRIKNELRNKMYDFIEKEIS